MKTLLLLRHAKSSWKDATVADHERRLNSRGRRAAELVRRYLKEKRLRPDLVLSSSSVRTRETVDLLFNGEPMAPEVRYDEALYLGSAATLLAAITRLPDDRNQVLLVAHNPGISELCFRLTGVAERFPTATLANIALEIENWSEAGNMKGRLVRLVTPAQMED